jgi:hypothetical protein
MIFRFVTGKLGSGKTLCAVGHALEYLERGATVATNVDFYPENFRNKKNRSVRIIRLPDHPSADDLRALGVGNPTLVQDSSGNYRPGPDYDPTKNSLLLLDELAQFVNARKWQDKGRLDLISYLVLLRKMGWDAIFIVQDIGMIDSQIREALASETGYCRDMSKFNLPLVGKVWGILTGKPLKMPRVHRVVFRDGHSETGIKTDAAWYVGSHLYDLYNTAQTYTADCGHGTYCLLTPWHLRGRYMPEPEPLLRVVLRLAFQSAALPAWAIYLLASHLMNGRVQRAA